MLHCSARFWNRPGNRTRPWMLHRNTEWMLTSRSWAPGPESRTEPSQRPDRCCVGVAGAGDAEIGIEARSWDTATNAGWRRRAALWYRVPQRPPSELRSPVLRIGYPAAASPSADLDDRHRIGFEAGSQDAA